MSLHGFTDSGSAVSYFNVFQLVEALIADIQHLESEVVRTRYELSRYLPKKERNLLRSDMLSNLGDRYVGNLPMTPSWRAGAAALTLWIPMSG